MIHECNMNDIKADSLYFFFSSRRRHTRWPRDWSSDVCSSDLAEKRVKTNLTLEAIIEAEDIQVEEQDVEEELEQMASMYNLEVDQIKQMLGGNTKAVENDLKFKKAIDFLVDNSVVAE